MMGVIEATDTHDSSRPPPAPLGTDRPHLGLRVLVAEDQEVGRKAAVRILESLGCRVDVAADGRQALGAIETGAYDVVLMDVELPAIGGLVATAEVRRRERRGGSGRRTPVLAMTAHALEKDRRLCLDCGLDGYLTKPVTPQDLFEALAPLALRRGRTAPAPKAPPSLRHERLNEISDNDPAFRTELVGAFLTGAQRHLRGIVAAVRPGDATGLFAAAHGLRGSCLTVGADALAASASEIEARANVPNLLAAAGLLPEVLSRWDALRPELSPLSGGLAWPGVATATGPLGEALRPIPSEAAP